MKRSLVKYIGCAVGGAVVAAVAIGWAFTATLHYPASWMHVSCGQARAEVLANIPGAMTELHDVKGDFWEAPCALGYWQMQVTYDQQRHVTSKQYVLYIGTRETFKAFYFL